MRFRANGLRLIVSSLLATMVLAGCGGEDESGPDTSAQDEEAVKGLLLEYAATVGEDACALWSQELLDRHGGTKGCVREIGNEVVTTIEVLDIEVDGDTAQVLVSVLPEDEHFIYPAVRDGDSTDSFDGWRIAEVDVEPVEIESLAEATETTAETTEGTTEATTPEATETAPQTAEEKQAAYRACIEGRGAQQVKQDSGTPPQVEFSGESGPVFAWFPADEPGAQGDLEKVKRAGAAFAELHGTTIVWSLLEPASGDLETATACAEEAG